jgi:hypothetical protein
MKGGGGCVERSSRHIIMCVTAALRNNASKWGGKGGLPGLLCINVLWIPA